MKPLVLLSFSLAFLTQGFADDSFTADSCGAQGCNSNFSTEEQPQASMPMESEDSQPEWCESPYHEMHASIRHNEANGIGYKEGYTTLEAFGIYDGWGSGFMPFVDLRGHVFNNGKLAGNVGIGERTLFDSINHTFGSYLYYDVRRVGHHLTVNQLSPGIELVGERMEYRINGYFPLGKNKGNKFGYAFDKFTGNNILLKFKQNQAMMGGDAEVGVHIPQNTTYDVYAAAGPYYFHSSNASAWGGKARLLGRYKEYVTLEVAYSYDKLFRNVVQGSIAFTVPFGGKLQRCGKCCPQTDNLLLSRAAFAPSRLEIPVVKKVHRKEKAIDPATGLPWRVWFVNNTSHSAGTFESPFPTLLQAQNASSPNDMIYVFSGDGTTHGMNAGITLQDGQTFFGSGTKQHFPTTKGTMTIPTFSNAMPMIAGGVTTGNSNVISGFNVTTGIVGNSVATNLNNVTVANNLISGAILFQGTGDVNIYNNTISGFATPPNLDSITLNAAPGGLITGQISNNTFLDTGMITGAAIVLQNVNPINTGRYDFIVANNLIEGYFTGIGADVLGTNSMVTIIDNTIIYANTVSTDSGIIVVATVAGRTGQNGHMIISNNTVTWGVPGANPAIAVIDMGTGPFQDQFTIQNNVVNISPNVIGIAIGASNTYCVTMDNNTVIGAVSSAKPSFDFVTGGSGIINIDSFENNLGPFLEVHSGSDVNFVAPGTCGN
jgi:hypothetical protein